MCILCTHNNEFNLSQTKLLECGRDNTTWHDHGAGTNVYVVSEEEPVHRALGPE